MKNDGLRICIVGDTAMEGGREKKTQIRQESNLKFQTIPCEIGNECLCVAQRLPYLLECQSYAHTLNTKRKTKLNSYS